MAKAPLPEFASPGTMASVRPGRSRARQVLWPGLAVIGILGLAALQLHHQGRPWWCACGQWFLWSGEVQSMHNSQHLLDPYSFTHVLHGLVICGILAWLAPRMPLRWGIVLTALVEALWELIENSPFIIERYRAATASLGYTGDTVFNSLGDILSGVCGYLLARWLGWKLSIALFIIVEVVLLVWIRDCLLLNILMLICPIEAIKTWQLGG